MKKLLLDTQALILILNGEKLPKLALKHLSNEENIIQLSLVSIWEMSIKISLGKLELSIPLKEVIPLIISHAPVELLPIKLDHILLLEKMPFHHKDPFDRLLAAQCMFEKLTFISADSIFDSYGVQRVWS